MDTKSLMTLAALGLTLTTSVHAETKTAKPAETKEVTGQCHGINSCKGTSLCHTSENACGGMNSCKGKGWVKATEKECKEKKGKFVKA